jgi:hypothetical protein
MRRRGQIWTKWSRSNAAATHVPDGTRRSSTRQLPLLPGSWPGGEAKYMQHVARSGWRGSSVTSGPLVCGLVSHQPSPWPIPGFRQSTGEGIEEIRIGLSPSSAAFLTEEYGLGKLFIRLARRRCLAMRSRLGGGSSAATGHHIQIRSWWTGTEVVRARRRVRPCP